VSPDAIAEGGFAAVAGQVQEVERMLALEDTTILSYGHAVAAELGLTGSQREARHRGWLVHSVLLVETASEERLA
jgi:hypothetical protein